MWNVKEKPFVKAASRMGPLPAFLFSNPILAGFITVIMCAAFGGAFVLFPAIGFGEADALELFEATRLGATVAVVFAAIILMGVAVSAFFEREEAKARLLFVFGGALGVAFLAIIDRLALENLRSWFAAAGSIVG